MNFAYCIKKVSILILIILVSLAAASTGINKNNREKTLNREEILNKAYTLLSRGEIDDAIKLTGKIPSLNSLSKDEREKLFNAFYHGFVTLSEKFRLKEALKMSEEWARLYPEDKTAMLYYGSMLIEAGMQAKALQVFEKGFNLEDKYKKIDDRLLIAFYYNAASIYSDINKYHRSLEYIQKMEKLNPEYPGVDYLKCRVFFNLSRFDEGLKKCESAFQKHPKFANVLDYLTYAGYYRIKKNYKKSLEIVMDALRKYPLTDGVALTAAADQIRLGNYYRALLLIMREDMIAGSEFYNNKNVQNLKSTLRQRIENSDTPQARKAKKVLEIMDLLNNGRHSEAIQEMDKLEENLLLYRAVIEVFRGEALAELGNYKQAESTYKNILSRDPTLVMAYCKLFDLYYNKMDKKQKAMEQLKRAKKIKPIQWKVKQIEKWLEEQEEYEKILKQSGAD